MPNVTDVMAHRGAHLVARENTLEAFATAVSLGVDAIELDARRTADGAIVVHHDANLHGDDGAPGRAIIDCLRVDLPAYVPSLAQALDACAGVWVNIEIKNDPNEPDFDPDESVAHAVMAHLADRDEPLDRWLISSFRVESIDRCRSIEPAVATAWLTMDHLTDATIAIAAGGAHQAIHPWDPTVDADAIARCHDAGLRVNTWTCNDVDRAIELASWGIDGICTDIPADVLAALRG